jgi:hypothetical protein
MGIIPLWGTPDFSVPEDFLDPFFWGYNINGDRLPHLDQILDEIDGPGNQTEVDLFLLGNTTLILIEAKHRSGLGRCSRYATGRCPEIHSTGDDVCRYWEEGEQRFDRLINFGDRPDIESESPPCDRHYQLGRTLLVGERLARRLHRDFQLWMIVPRGRWRSIEKPWLDFVNRFNDDQHWRRSRVLGWEDVRDLEKDK